MKQATHPEYHEVKVVCTCGNQFSTRSTIKGDVMSADVCSECHPFYTGKQKQVGKEGQVARFGQRFGQFFGKGKEQK